MFDMSGGAAAIRATMLAGAAAVALGGLTASAQAFPVAPAALAQDGVEAVQYYDQGTPHHRMHHGMHHGMRHGMHHRYGMNAHPAHPGHAGLYDCGPGGKATRLSRRSCGGNNRFQHLQQGY